MKFVSSKQFRAKFARFCLLAEKQDIIIDRPGGRMLRLQVVNDEDAAQLAVLLGKPEGFDEKKDKNLDGNAPETAESGLF